MVAAAAAVILVLGTLYFAIPRQPGLLDRDPIAPVAQRSIESDAPLILLSYPQGLAARRQVDLLFSPNHDAADVIGIALDKRDQR